MSEHKHKHIGYEIGFNVTPEFAERLEKMQAESLEKLEERRTNKYESEIREGEYEWIEVLVPSHLYISIRQIIETFLESHNANDGNGGWNKLKIKNGVNNE